MLRVEDDLDGAAHARMDEPVLAMIDSDTVSPLFLLILIVQNSEGKLDPKYQDVSQAVPLPSTNEYPQLGVETWPSSSSSNVGISFE